MHVLYTGDDPVLFGRMATAGEIDCENLVSVSWDKPRAEAWPMWVPMADLELVTKAPDATTAPASVKVGEFVKHKYKFVRVACAPQTFVTIEHADGICTVVPMSELSPA